MNLTIDLYIAFLEIILFLTILIPILTYSQNSHNLALIGSYNWSSASYDSEGSDIWGWVNPNTGIEYALVGLNSGFSVVDFFKVDSKHGNWNDIKNLSRNYKIMIDIVLSSKFKINLPPIIKPTIKHKNIGKNL